MANLLKSVRRGDIAGRCRPLVLVALWAIAGVVLACGSDAGSGADPTATRAAPTPTPTPAATATPVLKYAGLLPEFQEGDFWKFRWHQAAENCAQGSGCKRSGDTGEYVVTLSDPITIDGVQLFRMSVTGEHLADGGSVDFAPAWYYIGTNGRQLLASNGGTTVTIFDAVYGQWTGGGFFARFGGIESNIASPSSIKGQEFADWPGVVTGPAVSVIRSDSQSMCELIEGRRICPNDQSFTIVETQYYRNAVGPLGYTFRSSSSFSGGGFYSSHTRTEAIALTASSLRGDVLEPTPVPSVTPTSDVGAPTLGDIEDFDLTAVFGPVEGSLPLVRDGDQIPDYKSGVDIEVGAVSVIFDNPDVPGGKWSYGITFRHSEEETFHAVYVTGSGRWEHFVRGGTAESHTELDGGELDMNLAPGGENELFVAFDRDAGAFFVNGVFVAELDLSTSSARASGDVRVMTGLLATDTYNGASVDFYDLTVLVP